MTCELCHRRSWAVVRLSSGLRVHPACFWDSRRLTTSFLNSRFAFHTNGRRW